MDLGVLWNHSVVSDSSRKKEQAYCMFFFSMYIFTSWRKGRFRLHLIGLHGELWGPVGQACKLKLCSRFRVVELEALVRIQ